MNSLGLSILFKMGCICTKKSYIINDTKYVVREQLATGGFSLIDLVENSVTKRKFALKKMTCHSKEDQELALKEIEITRKIHHENVIKMIEFAIKGTADIVINEISEVYLVLPYYKNGSLQDYLNLRSKTNDHLPEAHVLQLFFGICEGVKSMHDMKPNPIAHRDLKTANICLSDQMEPIIVDLGSATEARIQICGQQEAQRLQDEAEERCSIVYRAPELFSVQSYCMVDERTDIWSLGCVLYAICFYKCPFDPIYEKGDSVALAVLSGNIIYPEDSPYSGDMHALIEFMLRLNPMERPYIYSVIERAHDLLTKIESRV